MSLYRTNNTLHYLSPFSASQTFERSKRFLLRQAKWASRGNGSTSFSATVHAIVSQALTSLLAMGLFSFCSFPPCSVAHGDNLSNQSQPGAWKMPSGPLHPHQSCQVLLGPDHLTLPDFHKVERWNPYGDGSVKHFLILEFQLDLWLLVMSWGRVFFLLLLSFIQDNLSSQSPLCYVKCFQLN